MNRPPQKSTRKVIYCLSDFNGEVKGPSYGCFFSQYPQSPEAKEEFRGGSDRLHKIALKLTWLLNQPGSALLACARTERWAIWTVQVEEPISKE